MRSRSGKIEVKVNVRVTVRVEGKVNVIFMLLLKVK